MLIDRYRIVDGAAEGGGRRQRRAPRCHVVLLDGPRRRRPLFLQVKEAEESVLAPYAGPSDDATTGERVVAGQRLMQAASDIFLGWATAPTVATTTCASCAT